ncbi:MAG: DUF2085 domain-containing protein [Thermoplasmata archaeon]|nr:DUF2085 domain-containing protein [Thermoplasmata archaeon]
MTLILHNDEHHITINYHGKEVKTCARCLGMYLGMIAVLPAIVLLSAFGRFEFGIIFSVSWILALVAIADWGTVKAKIWHGNNHIRLFSGFCLGVAGMTYLFLLPIPLIQRILSLWIYSLVYSVIHYSVTCKEHNLSLWNPISQNIAIIYAKPLAVGQCGMTGGCGSCCGCCSCPCASCSPCMCCPCCCCAGVIPLLCLSKTCMDKSPKTPTNYGPGAEKTRTKTNWGPGAE